jgi:hypothetical protein
MPRCYRIHRSGSPVSVTMPSPGLSPAEHARLTWTHLRTKNCQQTKNTYLTGKAPYRSNPFPSSGESANPSVPREKSMRSRLASRLSSRQHHRVFHAERADAEITGRPCGKEDSREHPCCAEG